MWSPLPPGIPGRPCFPAAPGGPVTPFGPSSPLAPNLPIIPLGHLVLEDNEEKLDRLDLQVRRARRVLWEGLEPRVKMDQMESLDPLELQENKVFLEYLVARGRLEILERRVPQDLLDNLVKLACLELRVAMGDQELLDLRDHKAIRVTQDPMGRQDRLVSMESTVSVDLLDQKVRRENLAVRVALVQEDRLV